MDFLYYYLDTKRDTENTDANFQTMNKLNLTDFLMRKHLFKNVKD